MAVFKPFCAFRPNKDNAKLVASRPYDVLNSSEAKDEADGNPLSFLHIIKPEIGLHPLALPEKCEFRILKKFLVTNSKSSFYF